MELVMLGVRCFFDATRHTKAAKTGRPVLKIILSNRFD